MATTNAGKKLPRVVIIGGGFAGLEAAKVLGNQPCEVLILDRTNHHLFQPLLYQVATAALAPTEITSPIRHVLRKYRNVSVMLAEVKEIDPEKSVIVFDDEHDEVPFDFLLLATGTRHGYFKNPEWEEVAPGLKTINDAMEIRQRFLMAFEEAEKREIERDTKERRLAEMPDEPHLSFETRRAATEAENAAKERDAFLTFVIVGAGPTGCELSGTIPEVAKKAMAGDFRRINTDAVRMILIEAGPRILPQFPEDLAAIAKRDLEKLGVEILTGDPVTHLDHDGVTLKSGATIAAKTIIWAAGNVASPLGKMVAGGAIDKAGRVKVERDLSVPGRKNIFVAGDLMVFDMPDGKPVPGVAQGAIQSGVVAGRNILHRIYGEGTDSFSYWDKGNLAVIGRGKAIADLHFAKASGLIAWGIWLFIHILYLVGFRNRLSVLLQWANAYIFFGRGARLIQPEGAQERILAAPPAAPKESNPGAKETRQVWQ